MTAIFRLLTLVALMAMSLSIAVGPALAHPAAESAVGDSCEEHFARDETPAQKSRDCTAVCAALPAFAAGLLQPLPRAYPPEISALEDLLVGIIPEVATPPPKTA